MAFQTSTEVAGSLVEMPKSVVGSVLLVLESRMVLIVHRKPHLPDAVIAVIEPKLRSGEEVPTVHARSAMHVDYTMLNLHGKWESTKQQH